MQYSREASGSGVPKYEGSKVGGGWDTNNELSS